MADSSPTESNLTGSSLTDSSLGRFLGALVKPVETFRSIARRPTWVAPLLVLLLVSGGSGYLLLNRVDRDAFREQTRAQIVKQGREPSEQQLDIAEKIAFTVGPLFGVVAALIVYFLGAALLLAAMNAAGGEIRYWTSLSVLLYAVAPYLVLALLTIPVALGRDSLSMEEIQGGSLVPSSLAVFAPEDASRRLVALLSSFDLFNLWVIALMITGYHVAARVSKGAAAVVVLGIWVLVVLIKLGLASLGGG